MATSAQPTAIAGGPALPLVRRGHARWLIRAPGRRGALSPEEAAHALDAQRAELRKRLDWRRDAAALPAHVRDEIVDEAIGLVVMSSKPIRDEEHLQGAFWTSVGYLMAEHRAGRHELHVGSRRRVDFEPVAATLSDDSEPFDVVAARERIATAADLMAQLDPFEQRVMATMATHKLGVKRTAKALGEPIKTVLAASRSAERKLDQVAAITAAGRMCDYREGAIRAHAMGTAQAEQEKLARTHLAACAGCRSSYATLLREMREREFQRAASAAFVPLPAIGIAVHERWIERLLTFFSTGRAPSGTATAERTAGLLGGGGLVKAAAASTAIVIAGAGVGTKAIQSLETGAPTHPRPRTVQVVTGTAADSIRPSTVAGDLTRVHVQPAPSADKANTTAPAHPKSPLPSKDLEYLALGQNANTHEDHAAPTATTAVSDGDEGSGGPTAPSPTPTRTGGGTGLGYLGH